jgi:hypothetical protein
MLLIADTYHGSGFAKGRKSSPRVTKEFSEVRKDEQDTELTRLLAISERKFESEKQATRVQ